MGDLHPKVKEFKEFVTRHPGIIKEVRAQKKSWQEFFEDWYMFGEEDEMWEPYKAGHEEREKSNHYIPNDHSKKETDFMAQLFAMLKNIDINDLQSHINNISRAINNVQQIIEQFQSLKSNHRQPRMHPSRNPHHPFFYQKD